MLIQNLQATILIAFAIICAVHSAENSNEYLQLLNQTNNLDDKLIIADIVLARLHAAYKEKTQKLYQQLATDAIRQEMTNTSSLLNSNVQAEQDILKNNALLLANRLRTGNAEKVQDYCGYLIANYDEHDLKTIYAAAVDILYNVATADELVKQLALTYINGNSFQYYEQMIQAQLYLYWKFVSRDDINDSFFINVAYIFENNEKDCYFKQLNSRMRERFTQAMDNLPSTIKNFLFKPEFCLRNRAVPEYLYTASNFLSRGPNRYSVFTWKWKEPIGTAGHWEKKEIENSQPLLDAQVTLRSTLFDMYLVLERELAKEMHMIIAQQLRDVPDSIKWSVALTDNHIVLMQDNLIMCASDQFYDQYRRYVYGYDDEEHTTATAACQWIADDCRFY